MIKKVSLTIISVILLFTIITTVKGLGTFEKLVLKEYKNYNKVDLFTEIEMHKIYIVYLIT
ncbi:hypothetical protein [Caldisalinibacter kiritimatiensis]|uniref:Uncharacterized protein n=1 Tax=Caldisalinibacter kiritimatiensis TaxID=1304284 RepID=R1CSL1_9FIRM|nr:hypothetical protein [Caldisalinibacter kiritimatiensis]EOD01646.1 hypothetical protein L21TH_0279 [Caldisalinibacter kiritimatiensis]